MSETPPETLPQDRGEGESEGSPGDAEWVGESRHGPGALRLRAGAASDKGRVRTSNEDAYILEPPMFGVADGMGGEKAGEVASGLAVDALVNQVRKAKKTSSLVDWVHGANNVVFRRSQREEAVAGMGTTLTVALAETDHLRLAHVGDSRAYLLRHGELTRLTADHTKVQELVDLGVITPEEARIHPQRNVITRALGIGAELQVDDTIVPLELGDRVLLCSDGLSGMIDDAVILHVLGDAVTPQEAADALVTAANEAGGADNVTAVVVDAEAVSLPGIRVPLRYRRAWALVGLLTLLAGGLAGMVIAGIWPFADDPASQPTSVPSATPSGATLVAYLDAVRSALPPGAEADRPFPALVIEDLEGPVTCDGLRSAAQRAAIALAQIPVPEGASAALELTIASAINEFVAIFTRSISELADQIEIASRASAGREELLQRASITLEAVDRRYAAAYGQFIQAISRVDPALPSPSDVLAPTVCGPSR